MWSEVGADVDALWPKTNAVLEWSWSCAELKLSDVGAGHGMELS
jgi:hypothetical protein